VSAIFETAAGVAGGFVMGAAMAVGVAWVLYLLGRNW
jgi:hypothetical protein